MQRVADDYGYIFDVAQLSHIELLSPDPDKTVWFFRDLLGMDEILRDGQSVYLRAYEERYFGSLKITESPRAGLGHVGWRVRSPKALERRVEALQKSGFGQGWIEGDHGHGPAYRFTTPEGHVMEVFWEAEKYQPPKEKQSRLLNRPQKRPARGIPVKRIDHVNLFARDVKRCAEFMMAYLGFQLREYIEMSDGSYRGAWLSISPLVHEIAFMADGTGVGGRFHHVAYWYGAPLNLYELGDLLREEGIFIEGGPGKHGITQAMWLYVYEPGGRNRVELFGDTGYLIFDPDWEPIRWSAEEIAAGNQINPWLNRTLETYYTHATPEVEETVLA